MKWMHEDNHGKSHAEQRRRDAHPGLRRLPGRSGRDRSRRVRRSCCGLPADRHRSRIRQRGSRRCRDREERHPREELFITTKLWVQDAGEENTIRAFETSLSKLGLDYLDLYLIHQPFGDYYAEWRAMERLNKDGRARAIGVSNFPADKLLDLIINNEIVPAVNQIETNPFHQQSQYQEILEAEGVQIESWGPFAEGKNDLFNNPLLAEIGAPYGKSVAQVVLRWLIQRGVVVIPKTVNPDRMAQNFDVFDFTLTDDDMAKIATLDEAASQFFDHSDPDMVRWLSARRVS
jgi:2,5-diketo-D-gluconate reductase A